MQPLLLAIILAPMLLLIIFVIQPTSKKTVKKNLVNLSLLKENSKVVDIVDCNEIEKVAEYKDGKLVLCRCW